MISYDTRHELENIGDEDDNKDIEEFFKIDIPSKDVEESEERPHKEIN